MFVENQGAIVDFHIGFMMFSGHGVVLLDNGFLAFWKVLLDVQLGIRGLEY